MDGWLLLHQPEVAILNEDIEFGRVAGEEALRSRIIAWEVLKMYLLSKSWILEESMLREERRGILLL